MTADYKPGFDTAASSNPTRPGPNGARTTGSADGAVAVVSGTTIVSTRVPGNVADALHALADSSGRGLSEILRDAALTPKR